MAMNSILVTGAAGFIGSHLVEHLLNQGGSARQLRLVLAPWDTLENLQHLNLAAATIIRADIRDRAAMLAATQGVSYVYHLAAKIDFDGSSYAEYEAINVIATQHLLDGCIGQPIKKFVFYSSIAVFGLPAGIGDINGWDETHPPTYTNWYGQSKWAGEQQVLAAHQQHGLPYAIIRPASVYGPREKGPTLALYRAIKHHQFMMIGDGTNLMHYVYVTDLVAATYLAAQSSRVTGDYIIAGARPTRFAAVVTAIAESINCGVPTFKIPTLVAMLLAYCLQAAGQLVGITPPLFPSRVKTMTTSYYYSIAKARRELDYQPQVSFRRGAQLTGQWYEQQGWL